MFVSKDNLTRGQTVVFEKARIHEPLMHGSRKNVYIANKVESEKVILKFMDIAKNYMR